MTDISFNGESWRPNLIWPEGMSGNWISVNQVDGFLFIFRIKYLAKENADQIMDISILSIYFCLHNPIYRDSFQNKVCGWFNQTNSWLTSVEPASNDWGFMAVLTGELVLNVFIIWATVQMSFFLQSVDLVQATSRAPTSGQQVSFWACCYALGRICRNGWSADTFCEGICAAAFQLWLALSGRAPTLLCSSQDYTPTLGNSRIMHLTAKVAWI